MRSHSGPEREYLTIDVDREVLALGAAVRPHRALDDGADPVSRRSVIGRGKAVPGMPIAD
jgi:hypothetical protein